MIPGGASATGSNILFKPIPKLPKHNFTRYKSEIKQRSNIPQMANKIDQKPLIMPSVPN